MKNSPSSLISIVCPVFNEEEAIPLFYARLKTVLQSMGDFDFEVLFSNNQSTDNSLQVIRHLQKNDPTLHVITLTRNFGYQSSILAGISHARGDAILAIDVDCEDPPELIPLFVQKWKEGNDICYGIRGKREEARWITWFRLLFYRLLKFTADTDIILDMAEFSILSKRVRDSIIKNENTFPFLRAEIAYSGFKKVGIRYDRQKRVSGKSKFSLWRMFHFAVAGMLSISTFPLRAPVYLFPFLVLLNGLGLWLSYLKSTSFVIPALFVFDFLYLIALLSAQGLYVARIYKNGINRPIYIVDWDQSDASINPQSEEFKFEKGS